MPGQLLPHLAMRRDYCRRGYPIPVGDSSFAENPSLPACYAHILFDAATDGSVLPCTVVDDDPHGLDLGRVGCFSAVLQGGAPREHVLLTDGLHQLRLDVHNGTLLRGPVRLRFVLEGLCSINQPLLTLRRLVACNRLGRMPQRLFEPDRRAKRWIAALRAADARRAGASQREVAQALFGTKRVRDDWSSSSDYLRSQVRRLLKFGARMTAGGWRDLLARPAGD